MQNHGLWRGGRIWQTTGKHPEEKRRKRKGAVHCEQQEMRCLLNRNPKNDQAVDGFGRLMELLKACTKQKDLENGIKIHATILESGLFGKEANYVGSMLIDMYAKCGCLVKAKEVFDNLPFRDIVSWTALISGYVRCGHGEVAIMYYEQLHSHGISPNAVTFLCILKACGSIGAIEKGEQIHAEIVEDGSMRQNVLIATALVDMYAKCGVLVKAQDVFNEILVHDVVSWTALMVGHVQHDHIHGALECFERMQCESVAPNEVAFTCVLKACSSTRANDKGLRIHAMIVKDGLPCEKQNSIGNALVDMYAKLGVLVKAQQVFNELLFHDVVSWNALMAGYVGHGHDKEALCYFQLMHIEGLSPDSFTFVCILKACGHTGALEKGKEIHVEIAKEYILERDIVLGTSLVDMYAECGALSEAREMFYLLPIRDVVSWTALMVAFTEYEHGEEAFDCFDRMQCEGVCPNNVTFVCVLKACGISGASDKAKKIHSKLVVDESLSQDVLLCNALLDMYARCGMLAKAQEVFDDSPIRDVVSWNALISGYAHLGEGEAALACFGKMQHEGFSPDVVTIICVLKACAAIAAIEKGKAIHAQIGREGLVEREILIGNALVDLYAKCGEPQKAHEVFDKLIVQDEVSWTALIAGYARHGRDEIVMDLFDKMVEEGLEPNHITYTIVLNVCSHSGLLEKGQMYFEKMSIDHGIIATPEHYTCMVDLFGRAGLFRNVMAIISKMPVYDHFPVWASLLGSCKKWGNVELAGLAFKHMIRLDKKCEAAYICMINIYVASNMQKEAKKIEAMRLEQKFPK